MPHAFLGGHVLTLQSLCSQSPKGSSGHGPTQWGRGKASAVGGVDRCHQPGQMPGGGHPAGQVVPPPHWTVTLLSPHHAIH